MLRDEPLFSDANMKKFILYNSLHGVLGFGATSGALGSRYLIPFGTGLQLLTPGSLSAPLLPALVEKVQKPAAKRTYLNIIFYVAYLLSLIRALRVAGEPGPSELLPVYVFFILGTIWDLTIFNASRGEHYGYMMLCLIFPDWVHGCQTVQIAIWMWAGIAKIGPWFEQVLPFLFKESFWSFVLPEGTLAKLLYRGLPEDPNPSPLAKTMAILGTMLELIFPLMLFSAHPRLVMLGSWGMICYHCVIITSCPFASVFEWNYFCIFMSFFLFQERGPAGFPSSPGLMGFLSCVSVLIPAIGQALPTLVPFLIAYRPYMGNWRMGWVVLHKDAVKKHAKIKAWASPLETEQAGIYAKFMRPRGWQGAALLEQVNYFVLGVLLFAPSLRLVVPVVEELLKEKGWSVHDVVIGSSETWQNQVFGWSLGTGWLQARECFREALVDCCGFEEDEMYLLQVEPASPFNMLVYYRCMDVAKGPYDTTLHGAVPFKQLVCDGSFANLKLTPDQLKKGGSSIRGTFFSTYYTY